MSRRDEIDKIVIEIMVALLKEGFNVQYYKAYSSNSVYLKFDYGASYSLRVSDHKGKHYLKYTFNLDINKTGYETFKQQGVTRRYYGVDKIDKLIHDIIETRNKQIKKCGSLENYIKEKRCHKDSSINRKGFWSRAVEYTLNDDTGKLEVKGGINNQND